MIWSVLLLGCKAPSEPTYDSQHTTDPQADLAVEASSEVSTVLFATWSSEAGATNWVEYGLDDFASSTPHQTGSERVTVLGLKAGRSYQLRGVSEVGGEQSYTAVQQVQIDPVPAWYSQFSKLEHDVVSAEMTDGFVLVGVARSLINGFDDVGAYVAILDSDGDYVWYHDLPAARGSVSPTLVGDRVMWDEYDSYVFEDLAQVATVPLDGRSGVDRTRLPEGHHQVIQPEPGLFAYVAREYMPFVAESGSGVARSDRIREVHEGSSDAPTEVFSLFSDYFMGEYYWPCIHTITPHDTSDQGMVVEWSHSNSIAKVGDDYLMYSRWIDTLFRTDRQGNLIWTMGGPYSDFTFPSGAPVWTSATESPLWSHGHFTQAWEGGLMLFDNATHSSPPVSAIAEYAYNEQDLTVEEVFRWSDPMGRNMPALGDARKLPGGNYLASWTLFGELTEVSVSGDVVWKVKASGGFGTTRITFIEDLYAL